VAGADPAAAVRAFVGDLQRAVSCLSPELWRVSPGGYRPTPRPHELSLGPGSPVRLRGERPFDLLARLRYRIVEGSEADRRWQVATAAYTYSLAEAGGGELLVWHWHPAGPSPVAWPHLHVGGAALRRGSPVADAHVPPRAPVRLHDVLYLALSELGARPRRADWATILELGA
jgi:hypothetical protein